MTGASGQHSIVYAFIQTSHSFFDRTSPELPDAKPYGLNSGFNDFLDIKSPPCAMHTTQMTTIKIAKVGRSE